MGGSADLAPSNKTLIKESGDFQPGAYENRNLRFGVREHGMGGIVNGMMLHGGVRPFGATFLVFSDYMRGALRLSALMGIAPIWIFTHDSVGVGEDGPTHQPVEHAAALRAIPNMLVLRPADARETVAAWRVAVARRDGPVSLLLTRQNLPTLAGTSEDPAQGVGLGGYVLADWPEGIAGQRAILLATGSEVHLAIVAREVLATQDVAARVVSLPSWELFEAQSEAYRHQVLPPEVEARVSIEAGATLGWERYTGHRGVTIGINRFGASAPYKTVFEHLGLTVDRIVEATLELVG
jgi:transketolase